MPLQKPYRGLANLAGLFEGGSLRLELDRLVQPAIDVVKFAEPPRWERDLNSVVAGPFAFYPIGNPVPDNERRIVWHMGAASPSNLPAGNLLQLIASLVIDNGAWQLGLEQTPYQYTYTSSDAVRKGLTFEKGLWLGPGDQLGYFVNQRVGATAIPMQMLYQYSKVSV